MKIDMFVSLRCNRSKNKEQDGRKPRTYRKRWKVERTFAWLGNFRRLVVRYERHIKLFLTRFEMASISHNSALRALRLHSDSFNLPPIACYRYNPLK